MGAFHLFNGSAVSSAFGLSDTFSPWIQMSGIRNITLGAIMILLALDGNRRALGHVYSATTFVELGSLAVIYAHGRREGLLGTTIATAGFVILEIFLARSLLKDTKPKHN